ncbi:hypothetical protein F2P56_013633 [Juglans regia]|uniref:Class V chitinase-like n=2 Tax=Juglans regia TaxID=51240 RepID=A0A2I4H2I9_JUGRE|nr:class V chitinase-like [Juglans regia]KAF5469569.1 hypothetical protein F2P56_013633 [Juglans regia]
MESPSHVKSGYWVCMPHCLPVAEIHSRLFTHLYAGFAVVHRDGGVTFPSTYKDQFQSFTRTVRKRSPQVKTLLSIGGDDHQGSHNISVVVKDADKRAKLIKDSIDLARKFDFDGLDLCWQYPSPSDNGADLGSFLDEWRDAVKEDAETRSKPELLLTAAVFHHPVIPGTGGRFFYYPCEAISDNLDWINVLAIDFYTPTNSSGETGPVQAWLNPKERNRCGSAGIGNWISNGVATKQLVLGLPFHGYEWILKNQCHSGFFAPAHPAKTISKPYRTILEIIQNPKNNYKTTYDCDYVATYSHNNKGSWIGYDNVCSISKKVKEASGKDNLGGYSAWHVGADDDKWSLSTAAYNAWQSAYNCKANP